MFLKLDQDRIEGPGIELLDFTLAIPDGQLDAPGAQEGQEFGQACPGFKLEIGGDVTKAIVGPSGRGIVGQPNQRDRMLRQRFGAAGEFEGGLVITGRQIGQIQRQKNAARRQTARAGQFSQAVVLVNLGSVGVADHQPGFQVVGIPVADQTIDPQRVAVGKDIARMRRRQVDVRNLGNGDIVEPRRSVDVLRPQRPLAQRTIGVEYRLQKADFHDHPGGSGIVAGEFDAEALPTLVVGFGGVQLRIPPRLGQRMFVPVGKVGCQAGPRVGQDSRLHVGLHQIVSAWLGLDEAGLIAVDDRSAVEIEPEGVLPGVGPVGGQTPLDVIGQIRAIELIPMHGNVFGIAQPAFLEVDGLDDSRCRRNLCGGDESLPEE